MHSQTRRDFMKTAVAGTIATGLYPSFGLGQDGINRKPNVVILFIDDLGYGDLGCFGNMRTPTPHIDSLAANGAKCTMSYITNPPCSPSRCCLMTGIYAQRFGKSGMAMHFHISRSNATGLEPRSTNGP